MNIKQLIKVLGPGLMWAGAAVGVSHLVQSTRAGANFGFELLWVLILANIIKYPFFEFGPRYAASTGKHLVDGYKEIGRWAVALYAILTVATMFIIQGAITIVTAGLLANILGLHISMLAISAILLIVTMVIIAIGRYSVLDKVMKIIILTLTLSTIIAVISAFNVGFHPNPEFAKHFDWTIAADFAFLIAFVGWMPAPIDISIWHSFWSVAKQKENNEKPNLKNSLLDFNIGYIGTAILAMGFLTLGAVFMYGTGESFSPKGTVFAGQLINLYTKSIGHWAYVIIAVAALATMFSTTLTCLDAYSRVLTPATKILLPKYKIDTKIMNWIWLLLVVVGSLLIIGMFVSSMRFMVDLATTISFVSAPILAYLNFKVVTNNTMPKEGQPPFWLNIYAKIGLLFLSLFSITYLIWKFVL